MAATERVAYLKGLFDGLELDTTTKEGKIMLAMLSVMEEFATAITDLEAQNAELMDEMDDLFSAFVHDTDLSDDEEYEDIWGNDDDLYQVVCPTCNQAILLDDELLALGSIKCSECGEDLEFDLSDLEDEDDDFDF